MAHYACLCGGFCCEQCRLTREFDVPWTPASAVGRTPKKAPIRDRSLWDTSECVFGYVLRCHGGPFESQTQRTKSVQHSLVLASRNSSLA